MIVEIDGNDKEFTNKSIRITLSDGISYTLKELDKGLKVNLIEGSMLITPRYANGIVINSTEKGEIDES